MANQQNDQDQPSYALARQLRKKQETESEKKSEQKKHQPDKAVEEN